mgnify:CR=1 FL=1
MKQLINKFFSKSFMIFFVIGVLTTIMHLFIYNLTLEPFGVISSNTIAFILSSLFSYSMNARFAFKKEVNNTSFWLSMFAFLIKLLASNGLAFLFDKLAIYLALPQLIKFIPIPVTCIIFPIQYLIFNQIFIIAKNKSLENKKIKK